MHSDHLPTVSTIDFIQSFHCDLNVFLSYNIVVNKLQALNLVYLGADSNTSTFNFPLYMQYILLLHDNIFIKNIKPYLQYLLPIDVGDKSLSRKQYKQINSRDNLITVVE